MYSLAYWETLIVEHVVPSQKFSGFLRKTSGDNDKNPKYKVDGRLKKKITPVQ